MTVSNDENSASIADPVGLQITRYIDNLGTAGDLPVYQWKTTTDANAMEGGDDQSSAGEAATGILDQIGDGEVTASDDVDPTTLGRYAVLAQVKGRANSFIDAAYAGCDSGTYSILTMIARNYATILDPLPMVLTLVVMMIPSPSVRNSFSSSIQFSNIPSWINSILVGV